MSKTSQDVLRQIKDEGIELIDLKFADLHGKWQHLTVASDLIEEASFTEGLAFDGSSIRGWKAINESDMAMVPDPSTSWIDPFYHHKTLSLICSIQEPRSGEPYARCPRALAQKALDYLGSTSVADAAFFGPEPEFFIFDDVRYNSGEGGSFYSVDTIEAPWNTGRVEEGGNLGYKIQLKEGYFPVSPNDTAQDMRSEMLLLMGELGIPIEKHHHEVAGAGQEISTRPFQLVTGRVWRGSAFGGARGRSDVPTIVDWYMDGKINIDDLITHKMPLEDINDAFHLMHEGKSIRSVVEY